MQPLIVITIIWVFVFGYAIFASVDFGTGCLYLIAHLRRRREALEVLKRQFQSPIWEVVNIFLIFIVVGLLGFFPSIAEFFGTSLMIPAGLALALMVLRGAFIVFQHHFEGESAWLPVVHGLCGILVPAALVTVLPLSEGGFVDSSAGALQVHLQRLATSPMLWAFVCLSVASVVYFASFHLCSTAKRHHLPGEPFFRRVALISGPPTFVLALLTALTLQSEAPTHFHKMLGLWPLLGLSALLFLVAGRFVFTRRYAAAFTAAVIQYLLAVAVYGWTHLPYLIYPYFTLDNTFAGDPAFHQRFIQVCAAIAVVFPASWLVYRIWLNRRFNKLSS